MSRGIRSGMGRRSFLAVSVSMPVQALAGHWPERSITITLPGAVGGLIDVAARAVLPAMQTSLGQPMRLDPRPGADGVLAAQAFLASPADGYCFYLTATSHVALPFLRTVPFDVLADFVPVAMIGDSSSLVCVPAEVPAVTVGDFVRRARNSSRPLHYLNGGIGTISHLWPEQLKIKFDLDIASVPYKAMPQGLADLLAGRLDLGVVNSVVALDHVRSGRLRAIAVVSRQRIAEIPDVATVHEQGELDLDFRSLLPIYGRRGANVEIVESFNAAVAAALKDPATVERLRAAHVRPASMSPGEVREVMTLEHDRLGRLIRQLGIRPEGAM